MVYVYTLQNEEKLPDNQWQLLLQQLPFEQQQVVLSHRRWQDRQASLGGKYLARVGVEYITGEKNLYELVRKDEYQRPYLPLDIDFNISHTKGMIVCALTTVGKIGIDVERLKTIEIADFQRVFTHQEYDELLKQDDHHPLFFDLWTKKEAIMKADGRGFHLDPASFSGIGNQVNIDGKTWLIQKIALPQGWYCHLATSHHAQPIIFKSSFLDFS